MAQTFAAQIGAWASATKERTEAVFKTSAQEVISAIQTPVAHGGAMRIDTGFLRASVQASLNGGLPPLQENPSPRRAGDPDGEKFPYNPAQVALVVTDAKLGDVITVGYGANYAAHVENRFGFVRLGAQRWPQIVDQVAREAQHGDAS